MVEQIIQGLHQESKSMQNQTWTGLVLGFLTIPLLIATAWHYGDIGAPQYGALIVTTGGASIVGLFLGVRSRVKGRLTR